jgi:hypothetical protein
MCPLKTSKSEYSCPSVIDGQLVGLIGRNKILNNQSSKIEADPAEAIAAHSTIREAVAKMVEGS